MARSDRQVFDRLFGNFTHTERGTTLPVNTPYTRLAEVGKRDGIKGTNTEFLAELAVWFAQEYPSLDVAERLAKIVTENRKDPWF